MSEQYIPFKQDMYNFAKVLERRLKETNAEIRLNTEITAEDVAKLKADVVMVAIGATPVIPPIEGIDSPKVAGLLTLHSKEPQVGQKVVILGGGLVGSEAAIYLDGLGKDVTVVEMKDDWAADAYFMHKNAMNIYIRNSRIKIYTDTMAKAVTEEGLTCETKDGELLLEADTILLAAGMKTDQEFVNSFYNTADRVFMIGDCVKPGRVLEAVTLGYNRAIDV